MSVQFGKWNLDGKPVDPHDFEKVRTVLAPYGPHGEGFLCRNNFGVLYRAFCTTEECTRETQPHLTVSGSIITWDGRLDNREELLRKSGGYLTLASTDVEIVAAMYEQVGNRIFPDLIGDWALSIWNPGNRTLILAKDFIGARRLYYSIGKNQIVWCSILDPLVLFSGHSFDLDEEYIAGWLAFFPATHLTPYVGIHAVPASSFVRFEEARQTISRYWDFDPYKRIRYREDAEYEEQFRTLFAESVRRRLRSDRPIVAELSGGMDSSSIVCMADDVLSRGLATIPMLDTISYYDNSESNWNELPYISAIEKRRGQSGYHIDVAIEAEDWSRSRRSTDFVAAPSGQHCPEAAQQFATYMVARGYRVLLSGIGGDEVTGGVPTAIPELADSIARLRMRTFVRQLKRWALQTRKPWLHLLWALARAFFASAPIGIAGNRRSLPWLQSGFAKRHAFALAGYSERLRLSGPLPSFQMSEQTIDVLRRQLGTDTLSHLPPYEDRFPFLDRDLVEFLLAVPAEQQIRPGQRRSLMRRALAGVVPVQILNRRRKAYAVRSALNQVMSGWREISEPDLRTQSEAFGIVDSRSFGESVSRTPTSSNPPIVALQRTIWLELWLTNLVRQGILLTKTQVQPKHAGLELC
jgi:asparagine synthase (glutamine-hydrolysing)